MRDNSPALDWTLRLLMPVAACLWLAGCAAAGTEEPLVVSGTVLDEQGRAYNRCTLRLEEPMSEGFQTHSREFSTGYFQADWKVLGRGTFVLEISCVGAVDRWRSPPFEAGGGINEINVGEVRLPRT